jgi:hypothetical protein
MKLMFINKKRSVIMEMLKKMALVLLLSGSCGLQAMHGDFEHVEWHDVTNPKHMRQHPDMYDNAEDLAGRQYALLREEYNTPEKIAALRSAKDLEEKVKKERDIYLAGVKANLAKLESMPDTRSLFDALDEDGVPTKNTFEQQRVLNDMIRSRFLNTPEGQAELAEAREIDQAKIRARIREKREEKRKELNAMQAKKNREITRG